MSNIQTITDATRIYFLAAARDAGNWGGTPLTGSGSNISDDAKAERGYLTALKKAGLITTFQDRGDAFIRFTSAGVEAAKAEGISI